MYEMAKKAREAMRGKAKRLAGEKDQKVDSSDFTPAPLLNADVKTGMRPISPRAYKKGGKVEGMKAETHAGRKPRKSGGRAITADSLINRNQKEANESREGKKHIGGMKRGGTAKKEGGFLRTLGDRVAGDLASDEAMKIKDKLLSSLSGENYKKGGRTGKALGGAPTDILKAIRGQTMGFKKGGRAHRNAGGFDYSYTGKDTVTSNEPPQPPRRPKDTAPASKTPDPDTGSRTGHGAVTRSRKAGGNVNYGPAENVGGKPGVSTKEQIAIERKAEAESKPKRGKAGHYDYGGTVPMPAAGADTRGDMVKKNALNFGSGAPGSPYKKGGKIGGYAEGGGTSTNPNLGPGPLQMPSDDQINKENWNQRKAIRRAMGAKNTGKDTFKKGGKAEAHEDVALDKALIRKMVKPAARTKKYGGGGLSLPNMGPGKPTGLATGGKAAKGKTNINIVINPGSPKPDQMAGMPGLPPGMPPAGPGGIPVPMGMPPGGAPPAPAPMPMPMPMPMPQPGPSPMGRKAGGKVYRSYKDLDAGSGSGLGRLEKTEIQKRKA
jgi:hypothetical protein